MDNLYYCLFFVIKFKYVYIIMFFIYRIKSGKIKISYKMDYLNFGCDVDFVFVGLIINVVVVLG